MAGDVVAVRRLSRRGERRGGLSAFGLVACMWAGVGSLEAVGLLAAHRIVYVPAYLALWVLVGLGAAAVAGARAARRAREYRVGPGIDDDAFAPAPMRLVHRAADGYRLTLVPEFSGRIEGGRTAVPVESLLDEAQTRTVDVPLTPGTRAELGHGAGGTFVVQVRADDGPPPALPHGVIKRFVRRGLLPIELCAVASLLCAVPIGASIGEADMKSAIPATATPWEIEKLLRAEAQTQARSLHQCFDVLPISCQRSGYVGVGVSLSREGEIRSRWIARSTYGADCPVDQCMSDVVSTWFFEPIPESMRVVLPVQVLRTDRPLPYGAARAAADVERVGGGRKPARVGVN